MRHTKLKDDPTVRWREELVSDIILRQVLYSAKLALLIHACTGCWMDGYFIWAKKPSKHFRWHHCLSTLASRLTGTVYPATATTSASTTRWPASPWRTGSAACSVSRRWTFWGSTAASSTFPCPSSCAPLSTWPDSLSGFSCKERWWPTGHRYTRNSNNLWLIRNICPVHVVPTPLYALFSLHADQHPGADEQTWWDGEEGFLAWGQRLISAQWTISWVMTWLKLKRFWVGDQAVLKDCYNFLKFEVNTSNRWSQNQLRCPIIDIHPQL